MENVQDLLQQCLLRGSLGSDEGLYRVGKKLQILYPEKFDNILSKYCFRMEKVLINFCGKYLQEIKIQSAPGQE